MSTTVWTAYCGDCAAYSGWYLDDTGAVRFLCQHWEHTAHGTGLLSSVTRTADDQESAQAWVLGQSDSRRAVEASPCWLPRQGARI